MKRLPIKLRKEPILEAVFEIRFEEAAPHAVFYPGLLLAQAEGDVRLHQEQMQVAQNTSLANLVFIPTVRLNTEGFVTLLGPRSFMVGCELPYPGWPAFRDEIHRQLERLTHVPNMPPVARYSLRYSNLIESPSVREQREKLALMLRIGITPDDEAEAFVQLHEVDGIMHHLTAIQLGVMVEVQGVQRQGALLSIDSIIAEATPVNDFLSIKREQLEMLRLANKRRFFNCLTESTLNEMGPEYE